MFLVAFAVMTVTFYLTWFGYLIPKARLYGYSPRSSIVLPMGRRMFETMKFYRTLAKEGRVGLWPYYAVILSFIGAGASILGMILQDRWS